MQSWDHVLNWRLLEGSHRFPGAAGGSCVNEAAVIAAGFAYRAVESVADLPPCFCPVISQAALTLNDGMDDAARQRLTPFVPRLAGAADPARARDRAAHFVVVAARELLPIALREGGEAQPDLRAAAADAAARLGGAEGLGEAARLMVAHGALIARAAACRREFNRLGAAAEELLRAPEDAPPLELARAADAAATLAVAVEAWDPALAMLDGALEIGTRADPLDAAAVAARMAAASRRAAPA